MPVVALPDRALLRVAGAEARPFLHNLLSQDVEGLAVGELRYGLLLTPQGRLQSAMFLLGEADGVLIDCAADEREALAARLTMFKLRAKVAVQPVDGRVLAAWGSPAPEAGWSPDPRLPALGRRRLDAPSTPAAVSQSARTDPPDSPDRHGVFADALAARPDDLHDLHSALEESGRPQRTDLPDPPAFSARTRPDDLDDLHSESPESGADLYDAHRLALGVPDPARDCPDPTYPIEADLDLLHAIDFKKGCFVGQETTSRMKRRGTIKSRLCPIAFDGPPPPSGAIVLDAAGRRAGEVRSGRDGRALALLRLDRAAEGALSVEGRAVRADPPPWLQPAFSLEPSSLAAS